MGDVRVSRRLLAAIAFMGHVPGLKMTSRCRFSQRLIVVNVIAVVLTLVAMATAFATAADGHRLWPLFIAWLIGHFVWSTIFAIWISLGGALVAAELRMRR
jgi:hypothetical protein